MDIFIDGDGGGWEACGTELENAVWNLGFLHLRQRGRTVIVTLSPRLVRDATLAAAFYRIADLSPELVYVVAEPGNAPWERFFKPAEAFDRLHELVAAAGCVRSIQREFGFAPALQLPDARSKADGPPEA